jgi:hypothetical protein
MFGFVFGGPSLGSAQGKSETLHALERRAHAVTALAAAAEGELEGG